MHKPSPGRMAALGAFAATLGMSAFNSTAEVFKKHRGDATSGMKWCSGVYMPGGETRNVLPTKVRNPAIASQMNGMHHKWLTAKKERANLHAMKEIIP